MPNNLQYLRHKAGLTQQVLSERSGIPRQIISELENGRRPLTLKSKIRLAKGLNIDEKEIEGG